jgi:hypothetical protein
MLLFYFSERLSLPLPRTVFNLDRSMDLRDRRGAASHFLCGASPAWKGMVSGECSLWCVPIPMENGTYLV